MRDRTKLGQILSTLEGTHISGENGLRDYHVASSVRYAGRIKDTAERFRKVYELLTEYSVRVAWSGAGDVMVLRNDGTRRVII
jgi:hypothetical protein